MRAPGGADGVLLQRSSDGCGGGCIVCIRTGNIINTEYIQYEKALLNFQEFDKTVKLNTLGESIVDCISHHI